MSLGSWTPTCSWLFAGIQSLSLPGLVQWPNPNHFPQGWRGKEGPEQAGRGDREGERLEWGRGYWGAGCRRHIGSGQSQLGQGTRSGMDKCLGCPENKDRASSLCTSPLLSSGSTDFGKLSASSSIACTGSGAVPRPQGGGWTAASKRRLFDSLPSSLTLTAHCSEIHLHPRLGGLNTQMCLGLRLTWDSPGQTGTLSHPTQITP